MERKMASSYSFQVKTKTNKNVATRPGTESGKTIDEKMT
jgi:hypothetical protein